MNKSDFLAALARELSGLPPEERQNALQYYEDYFADAGEENEAQILQELELPEKIARDILSDYRELSAVPGGAGANGSAAGTKPPHRGGISPGLLIVLLLLAIPLGLPLLIAAIILIVSVFAIIFSLAAAGFAVVLALIIAGVAICWSGVWLLFGTPLSGMVTIGGGLVCLALGLLTAALVVKLCALFIPPIARGFVKLCRMPFERRNRT